MGYKGITPIKAYATLLGDIQIYGFPLRWYDADRTTEMGSRGTRPLALRDRGSHAIGMIAAVTS